MFLLLFFSSFSSDQNFLKSNSIDSDKLIKVFVRTKGRIIPQESKSTNTKAVIEIVLVKETKSLQKWNRVDAVEYSEEQRSNLTTLAAISSSPIGLSNTSKQIYHLSRFLTAREHLLNSYQ